MSVTEIAVACGYRWMAQFSKAFRKRYGQSPRMVRKGIERKDLSVKKKSARSLQPIP
jgi:transcriptional regulator GlxA family with amidase domain